MQEPPFDNRRVIEKYCQEEVTLLKQAYGFFRREFMQIENLDVFIESVTIASACNKVLRKRFLQPDTIDLIHIGGYTCNKNYSKTAMMCLLHTEETDGV